MSGEIFGVYHAIVKQNADPKRRGRVILAIPQVLGAAQSDWAEPCNPSGQVPGIGSAVWAQFVGGDPRKPMYANPSTAAASIVVLGASDPVPPGTPPGTVIVRPVS